MQVGSVIGVQPGCASCGGLQPVIASEATVPAAPVEPVPWQLDVRPPASVPGAEQASAAATGVELLAGPGAPAGLDPYMSSIALGLHGAGQPPLRFRPRM